MLQDAVIFNFIVIGEATKKLDATLTQLYPQIQWKSIAGFRDILVHQYRRTRLELVWRTAHEELPNLKVAIVALLDSLEDQGSAS